MNTESAVRHAVHRTWFGAPFPAAAAERLAALGVTRATSRGTVLLREGAETTELGLVLTGRLVLTEHVPGRGSVALLTVEEGDIYGWSALVPPYRATSTVTAVEPTTVVTFRGAPLRNALAADPELGSAVYRQVLEAVARRLVATRQQLLDDYRVETYEPW
jgi:CRP-like cAMP-binding protein